MMHKRPPLKATRFHPPDQLQSKEHKSVADELNKIPLYMPYGGLGVCMNQTSDN
jgi:hypothetical protein